MTAWALILILVDPTYTGYVDNYDQDKPLLTFPTEEACFEAGMERVREVKEKFFGFPFMINLHCKEVEILVPPMS